LSSQFCKHNGPIVAQNPKNVSEDVVRLLAAKSKRKSMKTAIKFGLLAFALFAFSYVVEYKAILALETSYSGPSTYEYER
jgi:hypothetical protein